MGPATATREAATDEGPASNRATLTSDGRPIVELFDDENPPTADQAADKAEEILNVLVALKGGSRRAGQVQMAREVATSIVSKIPLLAQAGTGTGKSLAYLAGILATRQVGLVATHTKALQDQLVEDIENLLGKVEFDPPVEYALLKGRSAYACLRKVKGAPSDSDGQDTLDGTEATAGPTSKLGQEVVQLHGWVDEQITGMEQGLPKCNGDRTDVPFPISGEAWEKVSVSSDDCLGKGCPFAEECFANQAKTRAAEADLIVANQAILAKHMEIPHGEIVPSGVSAIVVDEAHSLPQVVAETFGAEITLRRLNNAVKKCKPLAEAGGKSIEDLQEATTNSIAALFNSINIDEKKRADREFLTPKVKKAMEACQLKFRTLFDRSSMLPAGDEAQKAAKDVLRRMLNNIVEDLDTVLDGSTDTQVIWAAYEKLYNKTTIHAAQFDVSETMFEKLIKEYKSVVWTSATMTVANRFDHISELAGFSKGPWRGILVESPFNYPQQSVIYQPGGAPDLKSQEYPAYVAAETGKLAKALGGRTLLLCTSWQGVKETSEQLALQFSGVFNIIVQERNSSFRLLQDRFKSEENSILIGTMGLWTGVSFEGDDCCGVVIDRLPFPSPEDPIMAAQSEAADRKYGKWQGFERVSIPSAATKMTQGSGRLIRTVHDRGILMLLDPRLRRGGPQYKRYAGKIIASLPPMPVTMDADRLYAYANMIRESAAS